MLCKYGCREVRRAGWKFIDWKIRDTHINPNALIDW